MTEQEKREESIEELAKFMGDCETEGKSCAECKGSPDVQCGAWNEAVRLYNRIEEARKEMAKKIFAELRSHCMTSETENCYGEVVIPKSYTWWEDDLNKLEKQFGVEVEE